MRVFRFGFGFHFLVWLVGFCFVWVVLGVFFVVCLGFFLLVCSKHNYCSNALWEIGNKSLSNILSCFLNIVLSIYQFCWYTDYSVSLSVYLPVLFYPFFFFLKVQRYLYAQDRCIFFFIHKDFKIFFNPERRELIWNSSLHFHVQTKCFLLWALPCSNHLWAPSAILLPSHSVFWQVFAPFWG